MTILQRRPHQELSAASFVECVAATHTATPNWYLDFRFTRLRCLQGLYEAFPFLRGHRDMLPFPSEIQGLSLPASPFPIDSINNDCIRPKRFLRESTGFSSDLLGLSTSLHTPDAPQSHYRKASISGERSVMPQAFLAKMQRFLKRDASGILRLNIDGTPCALPVPMQ